MAIVTINGQVGSGALEVGIQVAQLLEANYVDRLILAEAAKRIGATVEALAEREARPLTFGERLAKILQNLLEKSAVAGAGGEPYFGPTGMDTILSRPYEEASQQPITRAQELDDAHFIEATTEVIRELAKEGNVVIAGRGSNIILKDVPGALHVGTIASYEKRVKQFLDRERLPDRQSAERIVQLREKARVEFFKKFFKVHPGDPAQYHMMINLEKIDFATAASIIAHAASIP